jgi:hypothetical protein
MGIQDTISRMCLQTAVYWGVPVNDGMGGYTYDEPTEIQCRWEDKNELFTSRNGNEINARAIIYVLEDVVEEGMLLLGTLNDLDSDQYIQPHLIETAYSIKRFDKTPALGSSTDFIRKVYLASKNVFTQ